MSDEFIKVSTLEINEEIASIKKILESCKTDSDVSKNSHDIEGHFHKIKGLAPMMGKPQMFQKILMTLKVIFIKLKA
jgi:hypothetical protein